MWSSVASLSQSSTILTRLFIIIKDRKTSTDLQFTHIEVHIFLKLVGTSLSSVFEIHIFFCGGKNNAEVKIIFLKHVGKTTIYYCKMLFTSSPKHT